MHQGNLLVASPESIAYQKGKQMALAYFIDSNSQNVTEVEVHNLSDIRRYVGGYIEAAYRLGNEVIYVDEEGLLKNPNQFFAIRKIGRFHEGHQFFAGNGLYLGEEYEDDDGDSTKHYHPTVTLEELKEAVQFAHEAM